MSSPDMSLESKLTALADELKKVLAWNDEEVDALIKTMRDGGLPATEAWVKLLKRSVGLRQEVRAIAEQPLARYQQTIGRSVIAEAKKRLSQNPFSAFREQL